MIWKSVQGCGEANMGKTGTTLNTFYSGSTDFLDDVCLHYHKLRFYTLTMPMMVFTVLYVKTHADHQQFPTSEEVLSRLHEDWTLWAQQTLRPKVNKARTMVDGRISPLEFPRTHPPAKRSLIHI